MASNYYGAEQTKMADYGYGDDDPYSFGGYSATQQPMGSGGAGMENETQRKRSPTTGTGVVTLRAKSNNLRRSYCDLDNVQFGRCPHTGFDWKYIRD